MSKNNPWISSCSNKSIATCSKTSTTVLLSSDVSSKIVCISDAKLPVSPSVEKHLSDSDLLLIVSWIKLLDEKQKFLRIMAEFVWRTSSSHVTSVKTAATHKRWLWHCGCNSTTPQIKSTPRWPMKGWPIVQSRQIGSNHCVRNITTPEPSCSLHKMNYPFLKQGNDKKRIPIK